MLFRSALIVRQRWAELGPKLKGKLNLFVGTQDTFRLEGPMRLFAAELKELGSDATVVFAEGRSHSSLKDPHEQLWPEGIVARIHREMRARFDATHPGK